MERVEVVWVYMERVEVVWVSGHFPEGWRNPLPIPAMHPAPSPAPCQLRTSRRMFMDTVNGLVQTGAGRGSPAGWAAAG